MMKRFQFSIASLLGIVLLVALGFASLLSASDAWDSGMLATILLTLLASILLAVHRRDHARAYWLGFALFGWAYFMVSLVSSIEARLPSSRALALLGSGSSGPKSGGNVTADFDSDGSMDLLLTNATTVGNLFLNKDDGTFTAVPATQTATSRSPWGMLRLAVASRGTPENRARIMHSIVSLVMALGGGQLSRKLHAGNRTRQPHQELAPSAAELPA
jgi:hypothetical protein